METSAVGILAAPQRSSDRGLDSLKSEDFFRILVTELQQQDPLDPSETSDMISQVSDIRSIELSDTLNSSLDSLAAQQRTANAGSLIGKFVSAVTSTPEGTANLTEGVVTGVRFDDLGAAILELDTGQAINATDVQRISNLSSDGVAAPLDLNTLSDSILAAVQGDETQPPADTTPATDKDSATQRSLLQPWTWLQR